LTRIKATRRDAPEHARMDTTGTTIDPGLLRRYDKPGPRYTSYPTAPQFRAGFGEAQLRAAAAASNGDPIPRGISLYVHVPYCTSPCFYCGCNRIITRDKGRSEPYLARLYREIALGASLFDRDREVVQAHFGGGTPNFLSPAQLHDAVDCLRRHFHFAPAHAIDLSIELDPRGLAPADLAALAAIGFNRASLGVQDFDPEVQRAVNRIQGIAETAAVVQAARDAGMRSINIDLIYGLPKQTQDGFARTLDTVLAMRPDRLAVYGYAHLPQMFKGQRRIDDADLPTAAAKLDLLRLAIAKLGEAGYRYIGMDHFALPGDELARAQANGDLHRNFMGYTTRADSDLLGLGVSAISHIGDTYSQNPRELHEWEAAIDGGRLPVCRGMRLSADEALRADLIQRLMCQGAIDIAALEDRHGIHFLEYFEPDLLRLVPLAADGLVEISETHIRATPPGRLLLRSIAACFDAYLHAPTQEPARFSRAI
jgi:oxygen-independent coproporphyrinogen III oxidase